MRSFSDLLVLHKQLDELFYEHQRALLKLDLDRASTMLQTYEAELLDHIQDEEEQMLTLYRERVKAPLGGTAEIFLGEHDKLRQFIGLFKEEMVKLKTVEDLERGVLFMIDSQHLFKRLLVHHDSRERKILYPLLDDVTTEEEREVVFESLNLPIREMVNLD